jgi:hypothetical protein
VVSTAARSKRRPVCCLAQLACNCILSRQDSVTQCNSSACSATCRLPLDICHMRPFTSAAATHSESPVHIVYMFCFKRAAAVYCAQLSALSAALPGVDLSHISPCAVVAGDVQHVGSLMQLLAELSHMPEGGQAVCSHRRLLNQVNRCAS